MYNADGGRGCRGRERKGTRCVSIQVISEGISTTDGVLIRKVVSLRSSTVVTFVRRTTGQESCRGCVCVCGRGLGGSRRESLDSFHSNSIHFGSVLQTTDAGAR